MLETLPIEFLTMSAAGIGGFLMKAKAIESQRRQEERLANVEAFKLAMNKGTESANAAADRAGDSWGKVTRRVIAWAFVLGLLLLCIFPGFFEAPAIVQTVRESSGWLFGLIPGGTRTEFHELNGFIHSPALLVGVGHIVAFYFGQGAAKP